MEAIKPAADLINQQQDLELDMTAMGVTRFRAKIASAQKLGMEDKTVYGLSLLDNMIKSVTEGIEELVEARTNGKAGPKGAAHRRLKSFSGDYDPVSFITLRLILASLSSPKTTLPALANRIGRAIEDEELHSEVREEDRKFYKKLAADAKKLSAYHVKRKVVNLRINKRGMGKQETWPLKDVAIVGMTLIEIVINRTGLIEKKTIPAAKGQRTQLIVPTEATRKFIADRTASAETMRPLYEPMIVEPNDWSTPTNGGYLTTRVKPLRLVKTPNRKYLESLAELDMTAVYDAVNTAQRTAWTINPFIMTILNLGWDMDYSLGGIPPAQNLPLPPKPHDIDTNEEARKEWRSSAHSVVLENLELDTKRASFMTALETANRYSLFDKIYMPYQFDFRGRIYAVPQLNPQGPDYMKALLMFSEGKPIDEDSAPFLAIQVANTGAFNKIDKARLEDRVQWVYDNEDKIIACAENPIDNRWWTEADSPYCFLAACREWAGWVSHGVGFLSHLPIALDGSCSGIQHFSMALADEVGGAAVNLIPSEKPADIYTLVMEKAIAQVRLDISTGGDNADIAGMWLRSGLLTRSCFKRPTMTYGYGSSQFGFRDQIDVDTLRPAYKAHMRGEGPWYFDDNGFKASLYMARITQQAVEETVVKAVEAMAWLKEVARVVTAEDLPIRWVTPDGFPVVQHYREQKASRVDTLIFGSRVTLTVTQELPKVSKRQQASGLSPNFVHSLDATHLRMAVVAAAREGIKDFALVHDSFGTHAADTGRFFSILRETMVDIYTTTDVMQDFHDQMSGQISEENLCNLPQPPARGQLDLTAVLNSDFAFA